MSRNLIVGNIEIMGEDISDFLNLNQAIEMSKKLGNGWRMPTIEEMKYLLMFQIQYPVLGINTDRPYWTSEYDTQGATASIVFLKKN